MFGLIGVQIDRGSDCISERSFEPVEFEKTNKLSNMQRLKFKNCLLLISQQK